jgi:O-antigen/teichoic acid export membrane protein
VYWRCLQTTELKSELERLCRHYSHYFAGVLGSMLLGFVSFPVFTRVFSVADYGTLDFIQKIVLLLIAVAKLGFQHAVLRFFNGEAFASDRAAAERYYSTLFFGAALTSAAVMFGLVAFACLLPPSMMQHQLRNLLCLASILIFLGGMESVQWAFLRIEERTKSFSVAMIGTRAGTLALICLLLWLGQRTIYVFFAGAIGAEAAMVIALSIPLFRRGLLSVRLVDFSFFRTAAVFGAPLIVYELGNIILDSGDRLLVRRYLGAELLGYYSVAYNMAWQVYQLVLIPLNLALVPLYMKLWSSRGRAKTVEFLSRGLDWFAMIAAGLLCIIAVTARDFVIVLASAKYREASGLISTIVAGMLIYATLAFVSAGLLIDKKTFTMVRQVAYAVAANLLLNCVLLPVIGLQGAAIATLLSYALCIFLLARASFRVLPLRVEAGRAVRYIIAGAVSAGLTSRIEFGNRFVDLVSKGLLSVVLYVGFLALIDRHFRQLLADGLRAARGTPSGQSEVFLQEVASTEHS